MIIAFCNGIANMVKKNFTIRLSDKRLAKLRLYAQQKDKTMTQVLEECIDKLRLDTGG
jgi:predicted transcriptional regulator